MAALSMEMSYGLNIADNEDQFLRAAVEALEVLTRAMVPGAFLVDTIPIRAFYPGYGNHTGLFDLQSILVKYVPEWFPGAGFKTFMRVARRKFDVAINGPLEYVKQLMKVRLRNAVCQFELTEVTTSTSPTEMVTPPSLGRV